MALHAAVDSHFATVNSAFAVFGRLSLTSPFFTTLTQLGTSSRTWVQVPLKHCRGGDDVYAQYKLARGSVALPEQQLLPVNTTGPSSIPAAPFFRVSVYAARTLNAAGPCLVTLSRR